VCIYILVVEMCERLTYYAFAGSQRYFLMGPLGYDQAQATSLNSAFSILCYFTPLFGGWLADGVRAPVIILSGMIGSRQGWVEAPYLACPASPEDLAAQLVEVPGARVWIVPGVIRGGAMPDVMRGEETQIAGVLALSPDPAGTLRLVLPGTHSK